MKDMLKPILAAGLAIVLVASCGSTAQTGRTRLLDCLKASAEAGKILYGHQDDLCYGHSWKV